MIVRNPAQALVVLVLLFAPLSACLPGPIPDPDPNNRVGCEEMCDRMRSLKCSSGKPTPNGASCEHVCENIQKSGFLKLDLECRYEAESCEAADSCED